MRGCVPGVEVKCLKSHSPGFLRIFHPVRVDRPHGAHWTLSSQKGKLYNEILPRVGSIPED